MANRSDPAVVNRRQILRAGLLAITSAPLAACTGGYDTAPDPLVPLAHDARTDADAADALISVLDGDAADLAATLARVRTVHADALQAEVDRANRPDHEEVAQDEPGTSGTPTTELAELGQRLNSTVTTVGDLIGKVPRHRAGLIGAVAAGCAAVQALDPDLGAEAEATFTAEEQQQLELPEESVNALQEALAAEHAAVWVLDFVRAFLGEDAIDRTDRSVAEHRQRRDACRAMIEAAGATPVTAEPAYRPPDPVTDAESAMAVAVTAESDASLVWRGVLERVDADSVRAFALEAMQSSAAWAALWRADAGISPVVTALVGHS